MITLSRDGDGDPLHAVGLAHLEWDDEPDAMEAYDAAARALDNALMATTVDHNDTRTRWLGLDGKVTTIERTGAVIDISIGVPVRLYANR